MPNLYRVTGGTPLSGSVSISGAKNAASKMILATLLTDEPVTLKNVPRQQETAIALEIMELVGTQTHWNDEHEIVLSTPEITNPSTLSLTRKNRLSIIAVAPLLHRKGEAHVPGVEGDKIGPRPIDFHLQILQSMGAQIIQDAVGCHVSCGRRLEGAYVELPYPSVGATETAILAGVLARGRTVIRNAAVEPEITALMRMLQSMGAIIQLKESRCIEIVGVEKLHGCTFTILTDRMEAASYASMALATGGDIFIKHAVHEDLMTFLNIVRRVGGKYEVQDDGIRFWCSGALKGIELETSPHPGFMTDWQQPFTVVLTQAKGTSVVHETVYEDRFGYVDALTAMGADITTTSACLGEIPCRFKDRNHRHSIVIKGPTPLQASDVVVPDIRAGLAHIIAALVAEGTSTLTGIEHLDRGYERLFEKLIGVGANISAE